jgi:hypothetical protein
LKRYSENNEVVSYQAMSLSEAWSDRLSVDILFVSLDQSTSSQALGWNIRNFLSMFALSGSSSSSAASSSSSFSLTLLALRNPLLRRLMDEIFYYQRDITSISIPELDQLGKCMILFAYLTSFQLLCYV